MGVSLWQDDKRKYIALFVYAFGDEYVNNNAVDWFYFALMTMELFLSLFLWSWIFAQ